MKMYVVFLGFAFAMLSLGCTVSKKAQLQALADCRYQVESLDELKLNGKPVQDFQASDGSYKLSALAGLTTALFSNELPLEGVINLRISNPENARAAFNSFRYIIELQNDALFEGRVDQNVSLKHNEDTVVPLTFRANIFSQAKKQGVDRFVGDLLSGKSEHRLKLKIKPSIRVAGQNIYYPSYITVDENFGKRIFELI